MRRRLKSISVPIVLGAFTALLGISLLVGWIFIIIQNLAFSREVAQTTWLLIAGIISFAIIITVLVVFIVFIVRETLEVRRQVTFIDSVTHELKSPLASIKLCLETMNRKNLSEQQRTELQQMMLDDVDRLSVFIDDVLQTSRIGHGSKVQVVSDVNLSVLVKRCAQVICQRHKLPEDAIRIDIPDDSRLTTDSTALETALKNLMDNAVKYSGEPVEVSVTARPNGKRMLIEVTDNGIGVPRKYLRRIFDRFYRVPSESVRSRHGTGLGLFVVQSLVKSIGGKLEAHSDGPGKGTSMRILLPYGREAASS